MVNKFFFCCYVTFLSGISFSAIAQTQSDGKRTNNIQTAAPFLLIAPDARSGAMGDAGVATPADAYSAHWNSAKLAFMERSSGVSLSYAPWLRNVVSDVDLGYLTVYTRISERNTIGGTLRYFSYGTTQLTDENQNNTGTYSPNEFSIDGVFSRKYGENFSLGTTLRYIRSSLSNGQFNGQESRPATALAADASAYFKMDKMLLGKDMELAFGFNISNIGTKMNYGDGSNKSFLPTNLKLGGATTFNMDDLNKLMIALDLNKLLVPTNPIRDDNGNIIQGKDPQRSVPAGIFGSFSDAPGGFTEELSEISYSMGMEYLFNKQFAVRSGYFYETPTKGDRQYLTVGAGFKYQAFSLDLAYILANQETSPLAQTLRFSLVLNFGNE